MPQPVALAGTEHELIAAPRIDNLAGSFACLRAFLAAARSILVSNNVAHASRGH